MKKIILALSILSVVSCTKSKIYIRVNKQVNYLDSVYTLKRINKDSSIIVNRICAMPNVGRVADFNTGRINTCYDSVVKIDSNVLCDTIFYRINDGKCYISYSLHSLNNGKRSDEAKCLDYNLFVKNDTLYSFIEHKFNSHIKRDTFPMGVLFVNKN